ncbi:MAG TPA: hypothetical protein VN922_18870 [Bacteroidia bacterium]|jgi:hypothetical protein|nr:hypothetical protein [Bacteroidia bacterium]
MKNIKRIFFSLVIVLLPLWSAAQCSVCTAGVQSNANSSGGIGKTINSGILYLLTITYLVLAIGAIYFLRDYIKYYYRVGVQRMRMFIASL